jgi:AbrB family looped-hinge helix DNA binding protein
MPVTKVDIKGRVVLPNELRTKLNINAGDEFIVDELASDALVLRKVNLHALIEDIFEKAKKVDLAGIETKIEEEADRLARQKFKVLNRHLFSCQMWLRFTDE